MTVRAELAAELAPLLPARHQVIDHPTELATVDPDVDAVLVLVRTDIAPASNAGSSLHTFELWLVVPSSGDEATDEDQLDASVDAVLPALDAISWLTWDKAERSTWAQLQPAWRFALTILTNH